MKILAIGNSYSQDGTRYIHEIAAADGVDILTKNLVIGGCTLERHHNNILSGENAYYLEINGKMVAENVPLLETLLSEDWDIISIQQQSSSSMDFATFQPHLDAIVDYLRYHRPNAKLALHQTWAYIDDAAFLADFGVKCANEMFLKVKSSYAQAAKAANIDIIIPSGQAMENLRLANASPIYRDPIHASLGLGRYTLSLVWYSLLTGKDIAENSFNAFDEPVSDENIAIAKKAASDAVKMYR